jgi:mono/diheme cytochrome c family protein
MFIFGSSGNSLYFRNGILGAYLTFILGCGPSGNKPNVELIQDMMDQPAVKAQKQDEFFPGGISSLVPPSNTQPIGQKPYAYATDLPGALANLKNPIEKDFSDKTLLRGQRYFQVHCMICHGAKGDGRGSLAVSGAYPREVPSLVSEKVVLWPDAHIYHVIVAGQGVMGAYGSHIRPEDRWPVVNYIRHLQKQSR